MDMLYILVTAALSGLSSSFTDPTTNCHNVDPRCIRQAASRGKGACVRDVKFGSFDCCLACAHLHSPGALTVEDANRAIESWTNHAGRLNAVKNICGDQRMTNGTSYTSWCKEIKKSNNYRRTEINCNTPLYVRYLCMKTCGYCE